ncbi:hypothetical protein D3C84_795930 [compost metagenome]
MGVVQFAKEQRQAVVGPGHAAVAVLEFQFADTSVGQFLHEQRVNLIATGIDAVGQALMVRADAERSERKEAAVGQFVGVQQQLFAAFVEGQAVIGWTRAAVVPSVLIARRGAGVIQIGSPRRGQGQIGLENPPLDLFEQGFTQLGLVGGLRFLIAVFSLQVVKHCLGVAFLQPGIRIGAISHVGNRSVLNVGG